MKKMCEEYEELSKRVIGNSTEIDVPMSTQEENALSSYKKINHEINQSEHTKVSAQQTKNMLFSDYSITNTENEQTTGNFNIGVTVGG